MMDRRAYLAAPRARDRASGMTVLELVVAVAILGLVIASGWVAGRPHGAWHAARAARAFLLWARLEAVWTGRPVAVLAVPSTGLVARSGGSVDAGEACGDAEVRRLRLGDFGRVTMVQALRDGIVWLPGGGARSCDGGGVISGRLVLADGARLVSVVVSSLGRIRVEATP